MASSPNGSQRGAAAPELKLAHLASALNDPGVLSARVGNDGLPLLQRHALSPQQWRGVRGRLGAGSTVDVDAVAPHAPRLTSRREASRGLHAGTSADCPRLTRR